MVLRGLRSEDVDAVVGLSLRAWAPVPASLREVLGGSLFDRMHPDGWEAAQRRAVRATVTSEEMTVAVDDAVTGFVAWTVRGDLGVVEMLAVDPPQQRRGLGTALLQHALAALRADGLGLAMVETGGDPGHAPARRTYEAAGLTLLPVARYVTEL